MHFNDCIFRLFDWLVARDNFYVPSTLFSAKVREYFDSEFYPLQLPVKCAYPFRSPSAHRKEHTI